MTEPHSIHVYDTEGNQRFQALLVNVTRWPTGEWDAADVVFGLATDSGSTAEVRIVDVGGVTVWSVVDSKLFYPGVEVRFDMPAAGFPDQR